VIISIRDTSSGINPEIYPKLFTKFVTKSEKGTVLDCSYQGASWKRTEAGYGLKTTRRIMGPHLLLHCSLFGIVEDKIIFKPKTIKLDLVNPVV
jgi:hypothetical protein